MTVIDGTSLDTKVGVHMPDRKALDEWLLRVDEMLDKHDKTQPPPKS